MHLDYSVDMSTEIIQIRDVPSEDVHIIRARAAARNISLSQYLRDLIHEDASQPEMSEVLARITRRSSIDVDMEEIRSFIEEGRR